MQRLSYRDEGSNREADVVMHERKDVKEHGDGSFHAAMHLRECAEVIEKYYEK